MRPIRYSNGIYGCYDFTDYMASAAIVCTFCLLLSCRDSFDVDDLLSTFTLFYVCTDSVYDCDDVVFVGRITRIRVAHYGTGK